MSLILLGNGSVQFNPVSRYQTPFIAIDERREQYITVNLLDNSFQRLYEYLLVVPVFSMDGVAYRSSRPARYYPEGEPMVMQVGPLGRDLADDVSLSVLLIPESRYSGSAQPGTFQVAVQIDDRELA